MRKFAALLMAFTLVASLGCGSGSTGKGKAGDKELTVNAPDSVTINPDETKSIDVEIARKNFDEDVKITLSELPDGLEVVNGETQTIAKKKTTITLQLKADKDAKSVKNHKVKVHAEGGGVKTTDPDILEVTIKGAEKPIDDGKKVKKDDNGDNGDVEANLKQARENLEKAAKKQLEEANEALKKVKEKLAKASGEAKENLEKARKDLEQHREKLAKQLNKIGETTAEMWEDFSKQVSSTAAEVRARTQAAIAALQGKNENKKGDD